MRESAAGATDAVWRAPRQTVVAKCFYAFWSEGQRGNPAHQRAKRSQSQQGDWQATDSHIVFPLLDYLWLSPGTRSVGFSGGRRRTFGRPLNSGLWSKRLLDVEEEDRAAEVAARQEFAVGAESHAIVVRGTVPKWDSREERAGARVHELQDALSGDQHKEVIVRPEGNVAEVEFGIGPILRQARRQVHDLLPGIRVPDGETAPDGSQKTTVMREPQPLGVARQRLENFGLSGRPALRSWLVRSTGGRRVSAGGWKP